MIKAIISQRQVSDEGHSLPDSMHPVLRRVYLARGLRQTEQADLSLRRMHHPAGFLGMPAAASRVAEAVMADQRIVIVGDFDADGATGAALAVRVLRLMGAKQVDFRVPNRFDFGYGLSPALVQSMPPPLPQLLITVDNGISSVDGVALANERGMEVVITDHHIPGEQLPAAAAMVNPNLPDDPFPSKALSGVGVMFYLLLNVRRELRQQGWFHPRRREPNLARWLDLVALGTVADLVPLDDNNRILVQQGLERIRAGTGVLGIQALLHVSGRHFARAQASDLGFAVAPRLNAAGRLEDMRLGIECLLSDDLEQALQMATELDQLNQQRKAIQDDMQAQALQSVETLLATLTVEQLPAGICLYQPDWHQGIVGLVASRIKDALHRPTIAFAPEAEGADVLKGSARSVKGLHIRDILAAIDSHAPGLIKSFGGHAMAAGLSLPLAQLEPFQQAFTGVIESQLKPGQLQGVIETDGEIEAGELGLPLAQLLQQAGPWGQQFPEPLFEGWFSVVEQRVVGEKHLKLVLQARGGDAIDAIAFNTPADVFSDGTGPFHLVFRLEVNEFRGRRSPQLIIEHIV